MRCSNCASEIPAGEQFCPQCGVPVGEIQKCPHCGATLLPGERFCGECGHDVTQAAPSLVYDSPVAGTLPQSPAKKRSPWTWILVVVAALVLLGCLVLCSIFVIVPALLPTPTPANTPTPIHTSTATPSPTPTATFTPSPTPTPSITAGDLIYQVDFSDPGDEWEISESADTIYMIENEAYSIEVLKENWMAWNKIGQDVGDFILEFDAALVEGDKYNAYGALFAYQDSDNRYELDINGNSSFTFGKKVDGEWTELVGWTPSDAIKGTGLVNHIRLIGYQGTYTLYVNDQFVYEFSDDDLSEGQTVPVVTAYSNPPARATFDNWTIWQAVK
ncbi:MAG: zinc ribbon domain-containing protein [Anaerolineae bacterium]|nr:zinc ribbon domain-containing protein [Anaerolineae bacterium]